MNGTRVRWTAGAGMRNVAATLAAVGMVGLAGVSGLAVETALAVATSAVEASPAAAEPVTACTSTSGVIVAVDFSQWEGTAERGCAGTPTTGLEALHAAGFVTTGDVQSGTAFVCRITDPATGAAEPPPAQTSCVDTPPATAYWSSWHADAGQGSWHYAEVGAETYHPPPGSVTAWTFGGGKPPPFSPATVAAAASGSSSTVTTTAPPPAATATPPASTAAPPPATATPPAATATQPPATSKPPTTAPVSSGGESATGSSITTSPSTGSGDSGTGTASGTGRSRTRQPTRSGPAIVDVAGAPAHSQAPGGSALTFAVGAVAVLGLGGGAGVIAWRRRRAG